MSPLWRRRLCISLAPDAAAAVLMARGRKPVVEKKLCWASKPAPSDTRPWQGAVRALAEGIGELQAKGADATFVLSNHFVRYALLPWSDQVTGAEERQVMARISFEKLFGSAAGGWAVRLSDDAYGKPSLASAVDMSLPEAIVQACDGAGVRPFSVQPYLMSVFNQFRQRKQLAAANICLVVAEPHRVGLLMAGADGWFAVRTLPLRNGLSQELAPLLRRELLLAGLPDARVYLHAPGDLTLPPAEGLSFEPLDPAPHAGFSPVGDTAYAMAMSGVA